MNLNDKVRLINPFLGDNPDRYDENDDPIPGEPDTISVPAGTLGQIVCDNTEGWFTVSFDIPGHDGWNEWVLSYLDLEVIYG